MLMRNIRLAGERGERRVGGPARGRQRRRQDLVVKRRQLLFGERLSRNQIACRVAVAFGGRERRAGGLRTIGGVRRPHAEWPDDQHVGEDVHRQGDEQRNDNRPLLPKDALEECHGAFFAAPGE
jgi:hypothetical protein